MKARELREKSAEELAKTLNDLLREQFNLRMQRGSGQLARPSQMHAVRKDIARVKTIMHQRAAGNAK